MIAIHKHWTHALRYHRPRASQHPLLMSNQRIPPHSRHALILPHRRVNTIELRNRQIVDILLHARNKTFQSIKRRHAT